MMTKLFNKNQKMKLKTKKLMIKLHLIIKSMLKMKKVKTV